jgi:thiol:disulfide interchange protein
VLGENALRPVLEKNKVRIVVADLSTNDQRIWKELIEKVGDRGLPVNLVYSPSPGVEPIKLPKILSVANVTAAVESAAAGRSGD